MGAGLAGSTTKIYGNANVNQVQYGNKLQGLPPVMGLRRPYKVYRSKAGGNAPGRFRVFCLNQLGGVGNVKNTQFAPNADGLGPCPNRKNSTSAGLHATDNHDAGAGRSHAKQHRASVKPSNMLTMAAFGVPAPGTSIVNRYNEWGLNACLPSGTDLPAKFAVTIDQPGMFRNSPASPLKSEYRLANGAAEQAVTMPEVNPSCDSYFKTPAIDTGDWLMVAHVTGETGCATPDGSGCLLMSLYAVWDKYQNFKYFTDQPDGAPILCGTANPSQPQSIYIMPATGQAATSSFNNTVVASATDTIPYEAGPGGPFVGGCLPAGASCPASGP